MAILQTTVSQTAISRTKNRAIRGVAVLLVMLLAACSMDQRYKRQVSGDESYLDTAAQKPLKVPAGMILPLRNAAYDIPQGSQQGAVGKQLDIRPPVQPLVLLNGARTEYTADTSKLLLENGPQNRDLWTQVSRIVENNHLPIASRQDANQTLITDWVKWNRADENEEEQFAGRYQISVQQQGYQSALLVKSLGLRQANNPVTDGIKVQRYNVAMLNTLVQGLYKIRTDTENNQVARGAGSLDVQSGSDDSGLPALIVRAPYATVWQRLPAALSKIGMKVGDHSRSQGAITVTYRAISNSDWDALGTKDPALKIGDYKLQVGDLGNRSSLQFTDYKGNTLNQQQNDSLIVVLQAAFNQTGTK